MLISATAPGVVPPDPPAEVAQAVSVCGEWLFPSKLNRSTLRNGDGMESLRR